MPIVAVVLECGAWILLAGPVSLPPPPGPLHDACCFAIKLSTLVTYNCVVMDTESTAAEIELGQFYRPEELPENEMDPRGNPEWVSNDLVTINHDARGYEFHVYDRTTVADAVRFEDDRDDVFYRCVKMFRVRAEDGSVVDERELEDLE